MKMRLEQDVVKIDPLNLDKECVELPNLILQAADMVAKARAGYEFAKSNLEVVEADLRAKIAKNPIRYNVPKTTESFISSTVVSQDEYKRAKRKVVLKRHTLDMTMALLQALETKKKTLELLVQLYLAGYFSEPKMNPEAKETMEHLTQAVARKKARYK